MIRISLVVPTYNSKEDLRRCLESLINQTLSTDLYEIIIVDDGSTDGTESAVAEIRRDSSGSPEQNIRYFKQKNSGPAAARNLGIREAKGEIIVFTDSDCIADPNWLEEIDKSFKDLQTIGVSGRTISPETLIFPWRIAPVGFGSTTCNMAYRKSALQHAGGFNEKFEAPYYEDTDLILRLEKNGSQVIQNERAIITHPAKTFEITGLAKQAFLHQYDSLLSRIYPGYVDDFGAPFKPIFWRFSLTGLGSLVLFVFLVGGLWFLGIKALLFPALIFSFGFVFFVVRGYRFCISCWPGNMEKANRISLLDKTKTFFALLFYIPLFLLARIVGSIKYRKFLF